ncbi:MAG: DUF5688 family protein [Eubacteriales bacterium]|nr:DUF5688 family protein [Eubacteriales bacterium]
MNYKEFLSYVHRKVQENLGEHTRVELHHVTKNNAVAKDGLLIIEDGRNISPIIYLNNFYTAYQMGTSMPEIISDVIQACRQNQIDTQAEQEFYQEFSQVSGKVVCKLINYEKNREVLKRTPHFHYLDLAVVCCYLVDHGSLGKGTVQIYRSHLEMWEITEKELIENAKENTLKLLPWTLQSMEDLFADFGYRPVFDGKEEGFPMYILSNREKTLGASVILYDQVLQSVARRLKEDFYILPSSVHECMVVPRSIRFSRKILAEMVRDVNRTQVPPEDVLSNEVYLYDCEKHSLTL